MTHHHLKFSTLNLYFLVYITTAAIFNTIYYGAFNKCVFFSNSQK